MQQLCKADVACTGDQLQLERQSQLDDVHVKNGKQHAAPPATAQAAAAGWPPVKQHTSTLSPVCTHLAPAQQISSGTPPQYANLLQDAGYRQHIVGAQQLRMQHLVSGLKALDCDIHCARFPLTFHS